MKNIKVTFPDSKSLQPHAPGILPNISGNINSTTNTLPSNTTVQDNQNVQNSVPLETPNSTDNQNFSLIYIILGIIILLIIVGAIILKKRINNEPEKKVS